MNHVEEVYTRITENIQWINIHEGDFKVKKSTSNLEPLEQLKRFI